MVVCHLCMSVCFLSSCYVVYLCVDDSDSKTFSICDDSEKLNFFRVLQYIYIYIYPFNFI